MAKNIDLFVLVTAISNVLNGIDNDNYHESYLAHKSIEMMTKLINDYGSDDNQETITEDDDQEVTDGENDDDPFSITEEGKECLL